ncbi:hypothetical protein ABFP37_20540 [Burkholderia sp. RS01]|uniref:hypothetical protein n=1 Tax=unclassified Burkholderia TaxID=2613784 RepID=UPI0032189221
MRGELLKGDLYRVSVFELVVGSVTAGALGGTLIPEKVVGPDSAPSAFFLVLALEAYRIRRSIPLTVVAPGCALA